MEAYKGITDENGIITLDIDTTKYDIEVVDNKVRLKKKRK